MEYSFLADPLKGFYKRTLEASDNWEAKKERTDRLQVIEQKVNSLVESGRLKEEHVEAVISMTQWASVVEDYEGVKLLAELQEEYSRQFGDETRIVFTPRIIRTPTNQLALQWVLARLSGFTFLQGLNISAVLDIKTPRPFRQCFYCGSIWDKHGDRFPLRGKNANYCHAVDCSGGKSTSPAAHPDCCYGGWLLLYRKVKRRFDFIKENRSLNQAEKEKAATEKFNLLLEELYAECQSINWEIEEHDIVEEAEARAAYEEMVAYWMPQFTPLRRELTANQVKEEITWYLYSKELAPKVTHKELGSMRNKAPQRERVQAISLEDEEGLLKADRQRRLHLVYIEKYLRKDLKAPSWWNGSPNKLERPQGLDWGWRC